ncbi:copper-transporting ATPase [Plasmodium brasilianum]|uniref:Copper-transporting ATPase n=1 Tax=Plasmodium brasilianum TaxID=5824 RepID=A0ACB9YAW7_PLABR|nr:copper-transporting ATPase [Plasmodium brasilianum]
MALGKLLLFYVSENVKEKINELNVKGIKNIAFNEEVVIISYDYSVIGSSDIIKAIDNFDINGYFQEDKKNVDPETYRRFLSRNDDHVTMYIFHLNNKKGKKKMFNKTSSQELLSTNMYEEGNYGSLENLKNTDANSGKHYSNVRHANGIFREDNDDNGYTNNYTEEDEEGEEYDEFYRKRVNENCRSGCHTKGNEINGHLNGETNRFRDYSLGQNYTRNYYNSEQSRGDSNYAQGSENGSESLEVVGSVTYSTERSIKFGTDEENTKNRRFSVLDLFNDITRKKKKCKKNYMYANYDDSNIDKSSLLSDDKVLENGKKQPSHIRNGNIFQAYENYRSRNKEKIYICELRIYNMTCDSCGNKIISFLKGKNLIIDGNSFATESKIKLKINTSENNLISVNIKSFVNNIMTEVKNCGFNNDLIDLYKDDDSDNKCNLFDITLYVFREDVIKSYELLKNVKGIKNVEYDIKKEYIYILYDPEIIGIRFILEFLKKKKNIDAYYDEDKEKYFRSTKYNETSNSYKLIELFCCFFFCILIIILNNCQMNMGYMNGFYSYGNYKNYLMTYKLVNAKREKNDLFYHNKVRKDSSSMQPNVRSAYLDEESLIAHYVVNSDNEKREGMINDVYQEKLPRHDAEKGGIATSNGYHSNTEGKMHINEKKSPCKHTTKNKWISADQNNCNISDKFSICNSYDEYESQFKKDKGSDHSASSSSDTTEVKQFPKKNVKEKCMTGEEVKGRYVKAKNEEVDHFKEKKRKEKIPEEKDIKAGNVMGKSTKNDDAISKNEEVQHFKEFKKGEKHTKNNSEMVEHEEIENFKNKMEEKPTKGKDTKEGDKKAENENIYNFKNNNEEKKITKGKDTKEGDKNEENIENVENIKSNKVEKKITKGKDAKKEGVKTEDESVKNFKEKKVKGKLTKGHGEKEEDVEIKNFKNNKEEKKNTKGKDIKEEGIIVEDVNIEKVKAEKTYGSMKAILNSNYFYKVSANFKDTEKKKKPEVEEVDFLYDFRRDDNYLDISNILYHLNNSEKLKLRCTNMKKCVPSKKDTNNYKKEKREENIDKKERSENKFKEGKYKLMSYTNLKYDSEEKIRKTLFCKIVKLFVNNPVYRLIVSSYKSSLDSKILGTLPLRLFLIFLLSSIVYIYFGFSFILNGYRSLKNNIINMNVLISISSSFSYFYSLFLLLFCLLFSIDLDGIPLYFDSSALLICIMKFGFEIENFLVSFTKKKIEDLYERTTKHVYILEKKTEKTQDNKNMKEQASNFINSNVGNGETKEEEVHKNHNIDNIHEDRCNEVRNEIGNEIRSNIHNDNNSRSESNTLIKCGENKSNFSSYEIGDDDQKGFLLNSFSHSGKEIDINKIFVEDKKINLNDFRILSYPVQFVQKHDILIFYEGATLLIDGIKVNDEVSYLDESMISGEKKAIKKYKGDKIYAGSKCVGGIIMLYIKDISKGNYIEYIKKTLDEVNCKKTNLQLYADKIASIFIPSIIILCIIVFLIWFYLTYFDYVNIKRNAYFKLNKFLSCIFFSIHFSLSILCVACPCAVGLASPLSIAISSYICSNIGIIIKNINIFEIFLECNHFIFDKTGTLTVGKPVVNKIYISNNLDLFIDQLLKNNSVNNLSINFDNYNTVSDLESGLDSRNNFKIFNLQHKGRSNTLGSNSGFLDGLSDRSSYNGMYEHMGGEHIGNIYEEKNKGDFSSERNFKEGTVDEAGKRRKRIKKQNKSNVTLNFVESLHCSGKNVTFYSFTTQKDYYKIEIRNSVMKKEEKDNRRNLKEGKNIINDRNKSVFNRIVSFINNKRKKNKYDKISDSSLKEYFINNADVNLSLIDDSYTSETSSEISSENDCSNVYGNNYFNREDLTSMYDKYGALKKVQNNLNNGKPHENAHFTNNAPFDDKDGDIKEKLSNMLYLFLSLSLNIEKYSNHLYAQSINTYINNNFCINETFEVHNLKNEKNQGIIGIINDLSVTIGTLFFCYTKYKNAYCSKREVIEEKLNINNLEAHIYSCDCNVHKTYQFLYNYSNSKKNESNNIIFMSIEGIIVGFFTLVDDIKPEVFGLIQYLKKESKKVYVCTGDNYMNAIYISKILGIPKKNVSSNTLPMEKVHFVKKIQSLNDGKVCMIGDGINDCFALKNADLGLSLSTRSNVVMDNADACIVDNNISVIMKLFEISRKTLLFNYCHFVFLVFEIVRGKNCELMLLRDI